MKSPFLSMTAKRKEKTIQVTCVFEMDERTAKLFLQSSIERVINTSIQIIHEAPEQEHSWVNLEDWNDWRQVIVSIWTGLHNKIFRELSDEAFKKAVADTQPIIQLRKGD